MKGPTERASSWHTPREHRVSRGRIAHLAHRVRVVYKADRYRGDGPAGFEEYVVGCLEAGCLGEVRRVLEV